MIKYELLKWLFGWDYISWKNSADNGIARVHKAPGGKVWYFRYKITKLVDVVTNADQVIWLTCSAEDYGFREL